MDIDSGAGEPATDSDEGEMKRFGIAFLTACTLALWSVPALASVPTDCVTASEVFATSTSSYFVGSAPSNCSAIPGNFVMQVNHDLLNLNGNTAIRAGAGFVLAVSGQPTVISGNFGGGTITGSGNKSGCVVQTFTVNGSLVNVTKTTYNLATGQTTVTPLDIGSFSGRLVHHPISIFGICIEQGQITGSVTF